MLTNKKCFIILKKWNEVFPDLDYRALEAMYILINENIEVSLRVGYCEYLKSMSGHPGFTYYYTEDFNLNQSSYTVIFPLLHNKKQTVRREWIDHIEVVNSDINKAWVLDYYKNHPERELPKKI